MSLEGWTWEEMSMKGAAALNVNWPDPKRRVRAAVAVARRRASPCRGAQPAPKTYAEQVQELKDFFAEARAYRDAAAAGQVRTDSRYAAMIPALNGEIPVVVAAEGVPRRSTTRSRGARKRRGALVIRGGRDAIHVADRLKAENVPVILTSTMAAPNRDYEGYDGAYGSAGPAAQGWREVRHRRRHGWPVQLSPAVGSRAWPWPSACRRRRRSRP
jgi:hypothetical protein